MATTMKKAFGGLISTLAVAAAAKANTAGFASGAAFLSVTVAGDLTLVCPGTSSQPPATGNHNLANTTKISFQCRENILTPTEYDFFIGPSGVTADSVSLTVTHDDGSTKSHSTAYDSATGKSDHPFNLWASSIFDVPLLQLGKNQVSYVLENSNQSVSTGNWEVDVTLGGFKQCPPETYSSSDPEDCDHPYTYCQQYFDDHNNCL